MHWKMIAFVNRKCKFEIFFLIIIIIELVLLLRHESPNHVKRNIKKYILLWSQENIPHFNSLESKMYLLNNCPVAINCYVTTNKNYLNKITEFDAIVFDGRRSSAWVKNGFDIPSTRSPHQKYIFFSDQSSDKNAFCNRSFDAFFNWTATFKLNSDIPIPFIMVKNLNGDVVGPAQNVRWENYTIPVSKDVTSQFKSKKIAATVILPPYKARAYRYLSQLQGELKYFKYEVEVHRKEECIECSRDRYEVYLRSVRKYVFFYIVLEDSFDEDYVTTEVLTAFNNNAVPILYGGADYTKFLPPDSYLDARSFSPDVLAAKMYYLIMSPHIYKQYFRWRNHYTFHKPPADTLCKLCIALNNKTLYESSSVYSNFLKWWHSDVNKTCYKYKTRIAPSTKNPTWRKKTPH